MKLGSVFLLLEEVERQYIATGKPIDPALQQAYEEVKREADACLKSTLEHPTIEEIMDEHRRDKRRFATLLVVAASLVALAYVGIAQGWVK